MFGEFPVSKMFAELLQDNLLPAILFRTSRKQCDTDIERLAERRAAALEPAAQQVLMERVEKFLGHYGVDPEVIRKHPQYQALITTAAGAHHAGQLLI